MLRAEPARATLHPASRAPGRRAAQPAGAADARPLFGWRTKLRLLAEPLRRTRPPDADESVAAFVRRKFGDDILANLVAPFISGVYAGDPEWLSLASAFPPLRQLEAEHGSIIRGALKSMRSKTGQRTRPSLCNFRGGTDHADARYGRRAWAIAPGPAPKSP